MVGCRIAQGEQPRLDGKLTGFLVSSDKPNHFSVGWIDSLDSHSAFAGTISVDGTIDSRATHGHTGTEMVRFDGANQISFQSVPGNTLDGVDLTTTSDTIYLDGYLNGSRLATAVRLVGPYYSEYTDESRMGEADTNRDPVAFSATQRP